MADKQKVMEALYGRFRDACASFVDKCQELQKQTQLDYDALCATYGVEAVDQHLAAQNDLVIFWTRTEIAREPQARSPKKKRVRVAETKPTEGKRRYREGKSKPINGDITYAKVRDRVVGLIGAQFMKSAFTAPDICALMQHDGVPYKRNWVGRALMDIQGLQRQKVAKAGKKPAHYKYTVVSALKVVPYTQIRRKGG